MNVVLIGARVAMLGLAGAAVVAFLFNTACPLLLPAKTNEAIQAHANRHFGAWLACGAIAGAVLGLLLAVFNGPAWES